MTDEQTIEGIVVDIPNLKTVLRILIDEYTIDKLTNDGSLIDVELLHFQRWLNHRYPTKQTGKAPDSDSL